MGFHGVHMRIAIAVLLVVSVAPLQTTVVANGLPEATEGHRVLRDNLPEGRMPPTEPKPFQGYVDAPEFTVVERRDELTFYPCSNCHSALPANPQPRKLMSPHAAALDHGGGQLWCLDCHAVENRNALQTLSGEEVDFNDAYRVCGQCHFSQEKDWTFGAHGKRVEGWQQERAIYNCTHCHDPHDPSIKPRAPEPPPPMRKGLQPEEVQLEDRK